ncbi:MAG: c-type cytochrome [Burkholderiaceae bacterium]
MFLMRSISTLCASVVVAAAGAFLAPAAHAETVRVCVDPDNLPFSKSEGDVKGMYIELAELVGQQLDAKVEYVWWLTYSQRKAMRNTVKQGKCDAIFAVPTSKKWHARGLDRTASFLKLSYALIAPPELVFTSLEDLRDKTVGVQFQTNPHVLMSMQEGYQIKTYRTASDLLAGLAAKEVDAGMLWGPVAGYDNKSRYDSRWKITPLLGEDVEGAVSVAVRSELKGLKDRIETALGKLTPQIAALAEKYGIPSGPGVDLSNLNVTTNEQSAAPALATAESSSVSVPAAAVHQVATEKSEAAGGASAAAGASATAEEMAAVGKVKFNDVCAHCHGTNGVQFVKPRDLRRLKRRYDTDWEETARTTIVEGIPDLGMPTWAEILSKHQIEEVIAFLATIQK